MSCTLYFGALIIEVFKICLVFCKNSGEDILSKVLFDVSRLRWRYFLAWKPSEETSEEV